MAKKTPIIQAFAYQNRMQTGIIIGIIGIIIGIIGIIIGLIKKYAIYYVLERR